MASASTSIIINIYFKSSKLAIMHSHIETCDLTTIADPILLIIVPSTSTI